MDCIGLSFIQLQDHIVINFFYILYAAAFQSMNQLRNNAVLSSYPVIHMLLTTSLHLILSYDQTIVNFENL